MRGPEHSAKLFVLRKFLPKGGKDVSFIKLCQVHAQVFQSVSAKPLGIPQMIGFTKERKKTGEPIGPRRLNLTTSPLCLQQRLWMPHGFSMHSHVDVKSSASLSMLQWSCELSVRIFHDKLRCQR